MFVRGQVRIGSFAAAQTRRRIRKQPHRLLTTSWIRTPLAVMLGRGAALGINGAPAIRPFTADPPTRVPQMCK
jgi:hypothetical protein